MVKDFKQPEPRPRRARPRPAAPARQRRAWLWFLLGAGCGALAVWLAYNPEVVPERLREAAERGAEAVRPSGSAPRPRTRYEFYTLLPEMEVAVPEAELEQATAASRQPGTGTAAIQPGASYLLQVGSFRRAADAERLKAELALLGLEARIQTVSINGEQTWHRVRLGPFGDLAALEGARGTLRGHGYRTLALRIRAGN